MKDLTLKEFAPMIPPNNNVILMWTSDYEIHYKGQVLVKLKMQRQYSCRAFVRATINVNTVSGCEDVPVDAEAGAT